MDASESQLRHNHQLPIDDLSFMKQEVKVQANQIKSEGPKEKTVESEQQRILKEMLTTTGKSGRQSKKQQKLLGQLGLGNEMVQQSDDDSTIIAD